MIERTTSTSGSTGTGLKKCRPSTRSGREVPAPSFMIGTDEVFEARNSASGSTSSSRWNSSRFAGLVLDDRLDRRVGALEVVDARAVGEPVGGRRRGPPPTACPSARRGPATSRSAPARARPRPSSASTTVTSTPERAHTSAIPEPISPPPTTPIRMGRDASGAAPAPATQATRPWGPARRRRSSAACGEPGSIMPPRAALRRRAPGQVGRVDALAGADATRLSSAARVDVDHVVHAMSLMVGGRRLYVRAGALPTRYRGSCWPSSRGGSSFEESPDIAGQGGR